ncbi:uncharacterized protein [Medicago truncatula]|uniref:uncharacterized protein n=1 Tax=Medicago truncatula TaxID=3880 RepID=UPI001966FA73|nr:uncharacterized protein LOC112420124 [Medicago truncatula]
MKSQIAQLLEQNEALLASVETIQQQQMQERTDSHHGELDEPEPQPFSAEIWNAPVPENFKPPHLPTFNGRGDPSEHVTVFNTRMSVYGVADSLKCKLLAGAFADAALRWYMSLPRFSIVGYQDMIKKFTQQFSGSRHRKVLSTSLFNVRQGPNESLKEYLARFNESTIKVSNPNQEVFVGAFQNGLRAGQFNESLAQKPADSIEEVIARAECYVKGEESNVERKARDAKERGSSGAERRNPYVPPNRDRGAFKKTNDRSSHRYAPDHFTPLNTRPEKILKEVLESRVIPPAAEPRFKYMGLNKDAWCKYHQVLGHGTNDCIHLKREIEKLIQSGKLRGYTKNADDRRRPESTQDKPALEPKHTLHTISGGFAGGGESGKLRKKYARQVILLGDAHEPERIPTISFSQEDFGQVIPHDDDPLVISFQLLNWEIKRVLIDIGSSADVLYYDTFSKMGLSEEQLQPFKGTLSGFTGEKVHARGYVTLKTTFGTGDQQKSIKIRYLVINAPSSYNAIIGRPSINLLDAFVSTKHLMMKYPLDNGRVGVIRGDQKIARECYHASLKLGGKGRETLGVNLIDLDPREDYQQERIVPIEDLKDIVIGSDPNRTTKIGASLKEAEERNLIQLLQENFDLFAWSPSDMPGIDIKVACHHLAVSPSVKPVVQKKRKMGEEKRKAVDEEVKKLMEARFISEIKYPTWLENTVLVKKTSGKWRMCVDYTDLNMACPKDPYPLPNIDHLIDNAAGYKTLSFMDAYSGYNQIKMDPLDAPKTAFMTNQKNYHYEVMSFGLRNAGATFQRSMDTIFSAQIGRNLEVYVDDLVVKTPAEGQHSVDLKEIFQQVRKANMRLNPAKCTFGVHAGKFLGFLLTKDGIEANPDKCQAIINMRSPCSVKEVQQLTGRLAALSRFLSCAGDKAFSFFPSIKKKEKFEWTPECDKAFQRIKVFLTTPPILHRPTQGAVLSLYLSVSENALSSVLVEDSEEKEKPVYFVSRVFKGAELRYQKIEKLALAVVATARKLRPYFQSHRVIVRTNYPIKQILSKPDLAGRMVSWAVELSEYDILFAPRNSIKSQVLADFMVEFSSPIETTTPLVWTLSVDGSSNLKGSGAGIVLEGPGDLLIEQSLKFEFKASNNQAEYEALIAGMILAREMGVENLRARSDSQLMTNQISGEYQTKDSQLSKYLTSVRSFAKSFNFFEVIYVPREQNARADLLAKLASTKRPGNNRTVIQEIVSAPSYETTEVLFTTQEAKGWMTPILQYLTGSFEPANEEERLSVKKRAAKFTIVAGKLYKRGAVTPLLRCLGEEETELVLLEVHEGVCGSHIGGRSLVAKLLRAGYYWPRMTQDCCEFVKKCDKCQRFSDKKIAPANELTSVFSPWPFHKWGVDIVGPFPPAPGQLKFLIVGVDYFTKWVEAEAVSKITAEQVIKFYWKKIICRFGLPRNIVTDNGTQFASTRVVDFCKQLGIETKFVSVIHPQANGQAEAANKVILNGIKKKLEAAKGLWAEQLYEVLWSYHTTPHSTTGETLFTMVYRADAMLPVEIDTPTWRRENFSEEANKVGVQCTMDMIDEVRESAHIREFAAKQRAAQRYNSKVIPRSMKEGNLVLKQVVAPTRIGKLLPSWEGPYRVKEKLQHGAYKLEELNGKTVPRTWNAINLRHYYS